MKAMTTEQIRKVQELMEQAGDLYQPFQHTALRDSIQKHISGEKIASFEQAENTIKMIEDKLAEQAAIQKDLAKKAKANNKSTKEDTMKAIQPKEEVIIIEDGFDTETNNNNKKEATTMATNSTTCPKCSGTGIYNVPLKDGSIGKCFACKGTGTKQPSTRPMTEAQVKFIRNLFAEAKEFMTEDQQKNLIEKMRKHISGEQQQTLSWASAAIDKLKEIKRDNAY